MTNQLAGGLARQFGYSYRGQMTTLVDTNGVVFSYAFDGDGNRIRQSLNDCLETRFVYDGPNVILDLTASNEVATAYVNALGIDHPIERIGFIGGQPRIRFVYHADALGSIVALTDESSATAKTYAYEAFGRIRAETGENLLNRITYTAREALGDSGGWYYYRNRVLVADAGRFGSDDVMGFIDGPNLYAYCRNDPIVWLDSSGLGRITWRPWPNPNDPPPPNPPPPGPAPAVPGKPHPPTFMRCFTECYFDLKPSIDPPAVPWCPDVPGSPIPTVLTPISIAICVLRCEAYLAAPTPINVWDLYPPSS